MIKSATGQARNISPLSSRTGEIQKLTGRAFAADFYTSAVVGSITAATAEILFAGNPRCWACWRTRSSFWAMMNNYTKFDPANPPPPLMTGEPNSFAYKTMTTRIPLIIQNVISDHAKTHPPEITRSLQELQNEIVEDRPIRQLELEAPDTASWAEAWRPYQNERWLNVPWYLSESFFYRRLLEAAGYFGGNSERLKKWLGVDPFLPRKQAELQSDVPWQVLSLALNHAADNSAASFRALLQHGVWGNRVDLSYDQVTQATGRQIAIESEQANLLVDDTEAVLAHFQSTPPGGRRTVIAARVDFICDNAGTELLLDLALANFLLHFDWVQQITLHVKAHPTFVSDATAADVDMTVTAIKNRANPELLNLVRSLERFFQAQRLQIRADLFWNSSRFFWEMPADLQAELTQAHLVIIKGDANYRRLLGDSRWPTTVPVTAAVPYFPAPFVALRTMKSDPVVGLKPGQAEVLDKEDPEWRVNGKRGMIQATL